MDMDRHQGHGQAPRTWTSSVDMDMHHGHGHGPWPWTWTMAMDMDIDMQHGHGHRPWTWACSMDMDINIDYYWTEIVCCNCAEVSNYMCIGIVISLNHKLSCNYENL